MSAASQALSKPKLQNILFLTDFSPYAELAAPFARAIARRYGSTIHAAHSVSPKPIVVTGEFGGSGIELENEAEDAACLQMNHFIQSGAFDGVNYTQTVEPGSIVELARDLAASLHIDLLVMGTHGRRGLRHLFLGSVAEEVFRHAECPVLTVGPSVAHQGLVTGNLRTVLYATNFSASSLSALNYAVDFARAYDVPLRLVHAVSPADFVPSYQVQALDRVRRKLAALVTGTDIRTESEAGCKPPVDMILSAAKESAAGLIVMGAHASNFASGHRLSSVAHGVVCHAPCPVLTVRG